MATPLHRSPRIHTLLLGCFLTISACALAPVQQHDNIPESLPGQFIGNREIPCTNRIYWNQSFPSESLQDDIQTLMEENFELEAARARVEQAAAAYGLARSDLFPSLDATSDVNRSRVKEDEKNGSTTTGNSIAFGATLNWELDIWGRLKSREKAASLSLEEQQALADQTALDLRTMLVESWITHHAARKLEQVVMNQRKTNAQFLNLIELRLAHGQGNALDILQQRGRLVTAQRVLPVVVSRKQRAANAYAVLMGRLPDGINLPEDQWPSLERLSSLPPPRQMMVHRPDLKAAFLALQAADYEVAAAIADRLPRLSIEVSVVESGSSLSNIGDGSVLRFAGGLLAPVFDAGRLQAKAARRRAEAREALAVLEQAMRVAIREVEDAVIQELALFNEQLSLRDEISIAQESVEKSTWRNVNGQESFLSVLIGLAKLQTLQQNEIIMSKLDKRLKSKRVDKPLPKRNGNCWRIPNGKDTQTNPWPCARPS